MTRTNRAMVRPHLPFRSFLAAISVLTAGCAASETVREPEVSLPSIDPNHSPAENLRLLAEHEQQQSPKPTSAAALPQALPPGVEPDVLARRDPADEQAFLSLTESLKKLTRTVTPDVPDRTEPAEIDSEARTQALKHYAKGRSAAAENRHLLAITELTKAMQLDPTSPEILRELARSYIAVGNTSRAVELYSQLIRLEPGHSEALFTVGLAAGNRRDFETAAAVLGRMRLAGASFDHDPAADMLANFALTFALRELGYDRSFIELAKSAVNVPPTVEAATQYAAELGSVYRQRGEMWRGIGDASCRLGEFDHALAAYAESAALQTSDPEALHPRVIYAQVCLGRVFSAQLELLNVLSRETESISERDIRLCAYVREQAQPLDLLAQAVTELHHDQPEESSLLRAAASLLPSGEALTLLKQFVNRRPRDLESVSQLLAWQAKQSVSAAVELAVALSQDHPDLAEEYTDRLASAVPNPSDSIVAVRALAASPARSRLEARMLAKVGALGEAWAVCRQARVQWPDDRSLAMQELKLAAALQEPALFRTALAALGSTSDLNERLDLCRAYRAVGDAEQSVNTANETVAKNPDHVEALFELARSQWALARSLAGDPATITQGRKAAEEAASTAEVICSIVPHHDDAYEILTTLYSPAGLLADLEQYRLLKQRLHQENPESRLFTRLEAQEDIGRRRYEQALDRLLGLYDSDPADVNSLAMVVTAWEGWGRLDSAERWLRERLEQRPGDPVLLEQWVRVQLRRNQEDAVIQHFEKVIADHPDDAVARYILETVFRTTGRSYEALSMGEERLLSRPLGVRRELELAALYVGAELADKAYSRLEWLEQHAEEATLEILAGAIGTSGRLPDDDPRRDAMIGRLVTHTINRFPNAPLVIYGAGLRALARTDGQDAEFEALLVRAVSEAREAKDGSIQVAARWRDLAQALADDDQPAEAARVVRERLRGPVPLEDNAFGPMVRAALIADAAAAAQSLDPVIARQQADLSIDLIRTLDHRGDLGRAFPELQNVSIPEVLFETSVVYAVVGSHAGSEYLLRELITLDPNHAMGMNNLGYSRLERGEQDEQTADWIERAHQLSPDDSHICDTIGWLRYKQGRFDDGPPADEAGQPLAGALSLIQKSAQLKPEPEVFDHLGDVHWQLGDAQSALSGWKRAETLIERRDTEEQIQQVYLRMQQYWPLMVADPRELYQRDYGVVLERVKAKIEAVEEGREPPVAPVFEKHPSVEDEPATEPAGP